MNKSNRFKGILVVVITSSMFAACTSKPQVKDDGTLSTVSINGRALTVCDISKVKDTLEIPLSEWVEDFQIVRFEDKDTAFFKMWWPAITDKHIGIRQHGGAFKLFDRQGKFLCDIGGVGQGPGEYRSLYSELIDEKNKCIYLAPFFGSDKILKYGMDGKFDTGLEVGEKMNKPKLTLNEDGSLKEIQIYGKTYKGRELYDVLEAYVRRAFYAVDREEQRKGRDILWFIWASPSSPLFGKDKMTTFERYFIADKETHKETKGAYYHLLENEKVVDGMIREFGLDPETGHIINGHVPVHQGDGESPVKCNGKVIVIDGGFCKAYQKVTGIAGYTLIYNSYGLVLTAHEPFTSKEQAISKESDIVSNRVSVHYTSKRRLVGDIDTGRALKERIGELRQLLDAYRKGIIKEKK